ncbi:hypothetical protein D3C76_1132690 [compost metagenome]
MLALGVVNAQIKGIALGIIVTRLGAMTQGLERLEPFEPGQAADHGQDARMECPHQVTSFLEADGTPPQGKHFDQFLDEILARFPGKRHHGHRVQFKTQILGQQHNAQHQGGGLARPGPGDHRGRGRVAENHLPLRGARLCMGRQQSGDICLDAFLQFGGQRQAPVIEQQIIDLRCRMLRAARITDQQDLTALLKPFGPAFLVAIVKTGGMTAAETVGLAMQPGGTMLGSQACQAMAEEPGGQALEQRHLGQG